MMEIHTLKNKRLSSGYKSAIDAQMFTITTHNR